MRVLRTYARVYASVLDPVLASLRAATDEPVGTRFSMPNGLELASVGRILIVAGPREVLEPYTATSATLIVDDLDECLSRLTQSGATIVQAIQAVPTGRNLTAKLADGAQIEYVEWDAAQWERVGGRPA